MIWICFADNGNMRAWTKDANRAEIFRVVEGLDVKPYCQLPDIDLLRSLLRTASLLQQNSVACASLHHGLDVELNGLPGWLRDTQKTIQEATEALYPASPVTSQERS
jgi:hypothetical protein